MILRCAIARVMKAKRPFGAHVCFTPKTGVRADIPGPPVWATFGLMRRSIIRFNSWARASFGHPLSEGPQSAAYGFARPKVAPQI